MFSSVRKRLGVPGIIAVIALVFAMVGGAWAANGGVIIKKLSQIAPSVQKKLKVPGPAGPAGPQGATGSAGKDGTNGTNGTNGTDGNSVAGTPIATGGACGVPTGVKYTLNAVSTNVCNGTNGTNGTTGFTDTLPAGKTETGEWGALVTASAAALVNMPFNIPLAAAIPAANVHIAPNANCSGTAASPQAAAGHLCVYKGNVFPTAGSAVPVAIIPAEGAFGSTTGADKSGADLFIEGASGAVIRGSYAVTAP